MDPFISNFQSALQLVINSSNILGTNSKITFSKLVLIFKMLSSEVLDLAVFYCLKSWTEKHLVLRLYPEGIQ